MPAVGQDVTVYAGGETTLRFALDAAVSDAEWAAESLVVKEGLASIIIDGDHVLDVVLAAADTLLLAAPDYRRYVRHELWDGGSPLAVGTITVVPTFHRV